MASVTIVLTDLEDGSVNVKADFDPPLNNETSTSAQVLGVDMIEFAQQGGKNNG